ncbi:4-coumarate--CoA ligase family protein [Streptomyces botrytidirepellens]|uniref:4-coumarate--CoA ligase family protein n=1 Tax=Streptomyces botrytidirepellens TaxID=2486417 RepID=A0A3M8SM05_9ACTN|nr:4-coumarate--CoA ligase family protein [Streptomyces botrytidirepellens]RNF81685.1 4-coumarate--CoA ligase family protein [Streptomyces botrytidirepellens]
MALRSEFPDVPPVDLPIHDAVLGRAAKEFGDRTALIDGVTGESVGYAALDHASRRIAAELAAAGVHKGEVVALHSPNSLMYPMAFYGVTRTGAAVTTVHPLSTAEEFAQQLRDAAAAWIVTVSPLLGVARQAAEQAGGVREIFVCDEASGHRSLRDMSAGWTPEPVVDIDPAEDVAVLPYSSGTTGSPKGVMLTHRSVATNLAQVEALVPTRPGERVLAVLPFFHVYGLTALMNAPLRAGSTVIVLPRFDLDQFLTAIERYEAQALYVAPPIVLALAKHPAVAEHDLSSVRYVLSAAAPLDARLAEACARRLGVPPLLQAFGMTELSPGCHLVPRAAEGVPPGTVGKLLPSTEMRIVGMDGGREAGRDVGPGEDGEILIRGPQVMKGYLGRPDDTAAMVDADGWLHTGDIGHVDADGWLFVVDRLKELIKYKGYQVAPADLEAVLIAHEAVADAAVIGVTDGDGNEIPKAYVVRVPGARISEDELIAYVAGQVAPYKKVRRVEFTESVPRSAAGKILRRELRARERSSTTP